MNKCLLSTLDPNGKSNTPCNAYMAVSITEGLSQPNVRVYGADVDLVDLAVMLWAAENAIKSTCDQIDGLRDALDEAHTMLDEYAAKMFKGQTIMYRPRGDDDDQHDE